MSLITDAITPKMLCHLAYLAGYTNEQQSFLETIHQIHLHSHKTEMLANNPYYHKLCGSLLMSSAAKSLKAIMCHQELVKLLLYKTPSVNVVVSGEFMDKSELSSTYQSVLKLLISKALKLSSLKPSLELFELEQLCCALGLEALTKVSECKS